MEKTGFTNLINNLSKIAEKNKWIPRYDKELDYFFWTKNNVNEKARLVKVSHETSLYINPSGKIEGVFIEYLNDNFVEHNPSYKNFVKQFTKKINKNTYTLKDKKKAEKYLFALGESLRADIYQDAKEEGKGLNIDNLIKYALSK